jgi:hypothetical protein
VCREVLLDVVETCLPGRSGPVRLLDVDVATWTCLPGVPWPQLLLDVHVAGTYLACLALVLLVDSGGAI